MASKADFTDEEWEQLRRGVTGAGLYVSLADRSFFDTFKEAGALAKHLREARGGSESELIRELAEGRGTGFGMTASPDEVERGTLDSVRSAIATLEQKAPDQADAYRSFVMEVARSVADAAGGGETGESEAIRRIEAALQGA
ncbi:MAG: hypothetical protein ICV69_02715 [Thermoleophilaceae bacterium]|nr:hypothetical protein [Thermoleophilaceae bacterium]